MAAERGGSSKGRRLASEVILWALRWYLAFPISRRDLASMLADRGVVVDHTTLLRWVQPYAGALARKTLAVNDPVCGEQATHRQQPWKRCARAVDPHTAQSDTVCLPEVKAAKMSARVSGLVFAAAMIPAALWGQERRGGGRHAGRHLGLPGPEPVAPRLELRRPAVGPQHGEVVQRSS